MYTNVSWTFSGNLEEDVISWLKELGYTGPRGVPLTRGCLSDLCTESMRPIWVHLLATVRSRAKVREIRSKLAAHATRQAASGNGAPKTAAQRVSKLRREVAELEDAVRGGWAECRQLRGEIDTLTGEIASKEASLAYERGGVGAAAASAMMLHTRRGACHALGRELKRHSDALEADVKHGLLCCENAGRVSLMGYRDAWRAMRGELEALDSTVREKKRRCLETRCTGPSEGFARAWSGVKGEDDVDGATVSRKEEAPCGSTRWWEVEGDSEGARARVHKLLESCPGGLRYALDHVMDVVIEEVEEFSRPWFSRPGVLHPQLGDDGKGLCRQLAESRGFGMEQEGGSKSDGPEQLVQRMQLRHVQQFIDTEAVLNSLNGTQSGLKRFEEQQGSPGALSKEESTELEVVALQAEVEYLESELAKHREQQTCFPALQNEVQKLRDRMLSLHRASTLYDEGIAQLVAETAALKAGQMERREALSGLINQTLLPSCQTALQNLKSLQETHGGEALAASKLNLHALPLTPALGSAPAPPVQLAPALQRLDLALQLLSGQNRTSQAATKRTGAGTLARFLHSYSKKDALAPLRCPDQLLQSVLQSAREVEDSLLLRDCMTRIAGEVADGAAGVEKEASDIERRHRELQSWVQETVNRLDSRVDDGNGVQLRIQTQLRPALRHYKEQPAFCAVPWVKVDGVDYREWNTIYQAAHASLRRNAHMQG